MPGVLYFGFFYAWPLLSMISKSVTEPQFGLQNFQAFFASSLGINVLFLTIRTAAIVTVVCLVLAYPFAYLIVVGPRRLATVLLGALLVSLWMSLVARTFAWEVILRDTGVINRILLDSGLVSSPVEMMRTPFAVVIGMTHILLPNMVLPMFVVMSQIDPELPKAASSLGATPGRSFWRVFLPLSLPGVAAGCLLVFVLALGFYITPFLLGGTYLMIGQLVVDKVAILDYGYASAIAVVLLVMTLGGLLLASRLLPLGSILGGSFRVGTDN